MDAAKTRTEWHQPDIHATRLPSLFGFEPRCVWCLAHLAALKPWRSIGPIIHLATAAARHRKAHPDADPGAPDPA